MTTINVDGKKYQIAVVDTETTVKNMIAAKNKTIPALIRVIKFEPPKVEVEFLARVLQDMPEEDLVSKVRKLAELWNLTPTEIAVEWLRVNKNGKFDENIDSELVDTFKQIAPTDFRNPDAIRAMYKTFQENNQQLLKQLQNIVDKEAQFRTEYSKYQPLKYTEFIQDSVIIEWDITILLDPLELFNKINLNKEIPFVRMIWDSQTYYKVYQSIRPLNGWLEGQDTFTFKLCTDPYKENWSTANIRYLNTSSPYTAKLSLEANLADDKGSSNEDQWKDALLRVLGSTPTETIQLANREEKAIKGVFAVPNFKLSREVFLDLITNNPLISHYIYVDETQKLSSEKSVLYLYYSTSEESDVLTVFISEREATRTDPFFKTKKLPLFTPYLNVRISKAKNLKQIQRFQAALASVLSVYQADFSKIANQYNKLIPNFKSAVQQETVRERETAKKLKDLQEQDPNLFIHGYPTKCEQKRQPIPVAKKDVKQWEQQKKQILNYPLGSDNYFICSDENEFKWPGLIDNKLPNSEEYPYLPCCYRENQKTGNKKWNIYLQKEQVSSTVPEKKTGKPSNILTVKAAGRDKLGRLPRSIHHILTQNAGPNDIFYRQGVEIGNNSFLEAVLLALDIEYSKMSTAKKTEYVQDYRNNLASGNVASVMQEFYGQSEARIKTDILNSNTVFDSSLYKGLVENEFNCQIVIFTRLHERSNGEFEIPRYTQGYLFSGLSDSKPTVIIYKHIGIYSDSLQSPHYELIVRKNIQNTETTWYYTDPAFIRNINSYFLQSYRLYSLDRGRYTASEIPPPALNDATGQVIDHYGKCRGLTFKQGIFISMSPTPPANNLPIVKIPVSRPNLKTVQQFIKNHKLTILQQDIQNEKLVGLKIELPKIDYAYIPMLTAEPLSGIEKVEHLGMITPSKDNLLRKTIENKKIADFLMQLLLYNFAYWYKDQLKISSVQAKLQEIKQLTLAERIQQEKLYLTKLVDQYLETLIVNPKHDYDIKNLPRRLTLNNKFFSDGKLVVDTKLTKSRLGYYLHFMTGKNLQYVLDYSERVYLENYYTYADDFTEHPDQLIFLGTTSLSNWIENQEHGINNTIEYIPNPSSRAPCFYSHWALNGGSPVVFQNVVNGDFNAAITVAKKYQDEGINYGYNTNADPKYFKLNHTVYFMEQGVLKKSGTGILKLWQFTQNFYATILIP
jgi:hypothetical protein